MNAFKIPSATYEADLVPGNIKEVKVANRRADAMSWMDPHTIRIMDGFNTRVRTPEYLDYVRSIAESMKTDGYYIDKPITVIVAREGNQNVVYVTGGHTRLEAALIAIKEGADFTEIPVIILPKSTNMIDLTVDLYRGNAGRPLSTYETALVAKRLQRMDLPEAEIGRRLGLAQSHVNGLLLLAGAPRAIANAVVAEELSASQAIDIMRKHGSDAVAVLQRAKKNAEATGQTKVTASHLPGAAFAKAVKKSAPNLFSAARQIARDPGYAGLREDTRAQLDELLSTLEQLEQQGEADAGAEDAGKAKAA